MSNIGKKPVTIKEGVSIENNNGTIVVKGPKGSLSSSIPTGIVVTIEDGKVKVSKQESNDELEKFRGLMRALVANMVDGVTTGFTKKLELVGVGYRAKVEGNDLVLNVGFANPIRIKAPEGITLSTAENVITVSGINKQLVGDIANNIRNVRIPDPYKGKGIRYQNERIRRKVGKAAKAVGGK